MEEFLTRFFTNLTDRVGGPMTFRLILQPTMAILLAIRAGMKDAREDRPPYLWTILTDPAQRAVLIREGWKSVARVFVLAVIMEVIYQWIMLRWFYPGEALTIAVLLAVLPYLLLRGPINRLTRRLRRQPQVSAD